MSIVDSRPAPPPTAPAWYRVALAEIGVKEVPGKLDNPRVLEYLASTTYRPANGQTLHDEIPWCAAFVGWCLLRAGLPSTRSAAARSYLEYGVALEAPRFGCIVVCSSPSRGPGAGHVAFYAQVRSAPPLPVPTVARVSQRPPPPPPRVVMLYGGNQGNKVQPAPYDASRVLAYRWPAGVPL